MIPKQMMLELLRWLVGDCNCECVRKCVDRATMDILEGQDVGNRTIMSRTIQSCSLLLRPFLLSLRRFLRFFLAFLPSFLVRQILRESRSMRNNYLHACLLGYVRTHVLTIRVVRSRVLGSDGVVRLRGFLVLGLRFGQRNEQPKRK